jgi:Glucose / Sorbosone dehydrogenase
MRINKIFIPIVLLFGLAMRSYSAVFVLPTEINHFASPPLSRDPIASRTDTWEPPHIVLTNVASVAIPVWIANAGDGSDRLFVVQQSGAVIIVGDQTPFLNLEPNFVTPIGGNAPPNPQVRMVGIAFPPDYAHKGHFYLSYYDLNGTFKVSRFDVSTNSPDVADPSSEEVIGSNFPIGCNGGQIVFAPNGTLYLNLAGPIANAENLDALSGKMLALLNEDGNPLTTNTATSWPFSQYFSPTDCSEIGGAFAENSGDRMNGVYFYGDSSGTIWGLKFEGTNWVKYDLASPTFPFSDGSTITVPPPVEPSTNQTTGTPPSLPTNNPPIAPTGPITVETSNGIFTSSAIKATVVAPTIATEKSSSTSLTAAPASVPATNTVPEYPFIITAFGQDEKGRLYVANYGAPYWVQEPPNYTSVEQFGGGGIYLIQDDLLQFSVHEIVDRNRVTLEWQTAPAVKYHVQKSVDLRHWFDIQREIIGNGWVLSVSDLPYNSSIFYRVIAITPGNAD